MYEGILPLWKEKGMTSHDCVYKLRKILQMKRIGHTGTLDPSVEGVLPICLGQATKVAEYIMNQGKSYIATVSIGASTTTEDADGEIIEQNNSEKYFTRAQIISVLEQLTGEITQTPPMYSSVKVNGKRLYEYAREGKIIERPSRQVTIHNLDLLDEATEFSGQNVTFKVKIGCSKGTYIRTLAVKIGEILGFPAHMSSLVRVTSGSFSKEQCLTLAEVAKAVENDDINTSIFPISFALEEWPALEITEETEISIANGQVISIHPLLNQYEKIVFTRETNPVAVYIKHPTKDDMMKPEKIFPTKKGD